MTGVCFPTGAFGQSDDLFLDAKEVVGVFDGVTKPASIGTGCVHGAAWYVGRLAAEVGALVGSHRKRHSDIVFDDDACTTPSLPGLLAEAIEGVRGQHAVECDLTNPSTPAASLCLIRTVDDRLEYLVLCDAVLVLETADGIEIVTDKRFQGAMTDLPLERTARELEKRKLTNQPHGYWIAAATPEAALFQLESRRHSWPLRVAGTSGSDNRSRASRVDPVG